VVMNPVERVVAVLEGRRPDRPPYSHWRHFSAAEVYGRPAVEAHVAHLQRFDLDFLKIMNDNPYPHAAPVRSVEDLQELRPLRGDEHGFGRQLELIADLKTVLGDQVLMICTLFNAWAVLRKLIRPTQSHGPPNLHAAQDEPSRTMHEFIAQDEPVVRGALGAIGANLANFARRCLAAGADGVYLSVRDDWVRTPSRPGLFEELVTPSDLRILDAVREARFNMLHVCGRPLELRRLSEYPVHALHWADRAAGPSLAEAAEWAKPALCGGVDNLDTLPNGSAEDCAREVRDALRQTAPRPILLAPGCTYDPDTPEANLRAMGDAALESHA